MVWAQAPAEPKSPASGLPPDATFATVDGQKITAADMQRMYKRLPAQQQNTDPKELLLQYETMRRLAAEAEKAKLGERSPWKEDLEWSRTQVLASAELNEHYKGISVAEPELRRYYENNAARYEQAKVKLIYVAFGGEEKDGKKPLSQVEAKTKVEGILKQIREGADFVKLVHEASEDTQTAAKDGDFGAPIRRTARLPEPIRTAIFALKPGQVSEPVEQPRGFYVFRMEDLSALSFEQVKDEIGKEMKDALFQEWLERIRKGIEVTIEGH